MKAESFNKQAISIYPKLVSDEKGLARVADLLKACKLPYKDLNVADSIFLSYHDQNGEMVGSGGLEFYSDFALLRSLAVDEKYRGKKIGEAIVNDLLARVIARSIREVYLLTETAHDFFIKLGFKDVDRSDVPTVVKESSEFSSVCPESAVCMLYQVS
jgi:amino-acid N-acetyltransferase